MPTTTIFEIPVADGSRLPLHLARPDSAPSPVGVIVAHELFGVNPDIAGVVEDLATAGFLTLAPEFYHRAALAGRWLTRDDAGRKEGFALLHQLTRAEALADLEAGLGWLRGQPGIEAVALVGFSAGGHLAYLGACSLPIEATAILYGGWIPSTEIPLSQPTPTLALTPGITGRLLFLFGGDDALIDAGHRQAIGDALAAAGVDHELIVYPGVGHAFFWSDTPAFDRSARDDAWARILRLLRAVDPATAG
jgi:carboxymethylenebutenolidase